MAMENPPALSDFKPPLMKDFLLVLIVLGIYKTLVATLKSYLETAFRIAKTAWAILL